MSSETANIKKLIQLEPAIHQLFEEFIWSVAPHLARIKYDSPGIWTRNPVIEKQIDKALREFASKYKDLLSRYMTSAWEQSEAKNDSILLKLVKAAGVTLAAKKLLKLFNREFTLPLFL